MRYLLDTSALLAHYRQEAGWEAVHALFEDEAAELFLASVTLTEFGRRLYDLGASEKEVEETLRAYRQLFGQVTAVGSAMAQIALELIRQTPGRLPLVDALIAAAACSTEAVLVHRDERLRALPAGRVRTLDLFGDA